MIEHMITNNPTLILAVIKRCLIRILLCLLSVLSRCQNTCQQLQAASAASICLVPTAKQDVDDAGGVVEELRKGIESAQEVWELTLDTTRNKIIRMNLFISMAALSFSLATVPASFFGMNVISGLEASPRAFYIIVGATSASSVFVGLGLVLMFRKFLDKRRAQDLAALQDLLSHIDDIDNIFQVLASKGSPIQGS
eukprot:Gb_38940 [translate_table: standard]